MSSPAAEVLVTDASGRFVSEPTMDAIARISVSAYLDRGDGTIERTRIHAGVLPISHGQASEFALDLVTELAERHLG